jgi:SAM-dependent methyltransferase
MHPVIFGAFNRICLDHRAGGRVLEIGARPAEDTLLCLPALAGATMRVGLDLDGPHRYRDFEIRVGNANDMSDIADGAFDTVLCNSVLEHDPRFWKSLEEIKRVAKPGGLIVIGVPSYAQMGTFAGRGLRRMLHHLAIGREAAVASAPTLGLHDFPGDYYRFSEQAMRTVLLSGLSPCSTTMLLQPPRVIGWGIKPAG